METKRDTIGKISSDLSQQAPSSVDPIEIQRATEAEYIENLKVCVTRSAKEFLTDFFTVVITKNEKLMPNVFRNYFYARSSCPTPDYDQAVYHYTREDEELRFLWVIPSKDACLYLLDNAREVVKSEQGLLRFVFDFKDGSLAKWAKELNNEKPDSPLIT